MNQFLYHLFKRKSPFQRREDTLKFLHTIKNERNVNCILIFQLDIPNFSLYKGIILFFNTYCFSLKKDIYSCRSVREKYQSYTLCVTGTAL